MGRRKEQAAGTPVAGDGRPVAAAAPPIPLEPLDLLAGIAPGVDLHAEPLAPDGQRLAGGVKTSVGETGKMLRSGDSTIRRLIRTAVIRPAPEGSEPLVEGRDVAPDRAGVPPRTPDKPGE